MNDTCDTPKTILKFAKLFPKEIHYLVRVIGAALAISTVILAIGFAFGIAKWTVSKLHAVEVKSFENTPITL